MNHPPPEEDHEDLTDEQIAKAVVTKGTEDFRKRLVLLSCTICKVPHAKQLHALRRRAPHLYSRTQATCPAGHEEEFIFLVDWLNPALHQNCRLLD